MFDKRTVNISERLISHATRLLYLQHQFSLLHNMSSIPYEARINLALEAVKENPKLSLFAASKIYSISYTTLYHRRAGRPTRRDIPANSRSLTDLEEQTIVQYVTELYARAFPPRLCGVEDMANQLRRERDAPPIGKR